MAHGKSVFNNDTLDKLAAYIDEHFEHLKRIEKALSEETEHEEYFRLKGGVVLDASGNGNVSLPPAQGYDWIAERITVTSPVNGACQVFVDTTNLSDLVEEIGSTSPAYSDAFNNNIFVPSGSALILVFTGAGVAGNVATYNLQLRRIQKPHRTHHIQHLNVGES